MESQLTYACPPISTMARVPSCYIAAKLLLHCVVQVAVVMKRRLRSARKTISERRSADGGAASSRAAASAAASAVQPSREESIVQGMTLLADRLRNHQMTAMQVRFRTRKLGAELWRVQMADDGNCQFRWTDWCRSGSTDWVVRRALSHQMYGTQENYKMVRRFVLEHIDENQHE